MKNYDKIKSGKMPITREQLIEMINCNDDVTRVDTSQITNMSYMFYSNNSFNQPICDWDTSSVTDMRGMFYNNSVFNQPIGDWDTSSVTDMRYMFEYDSAFRQPIGDWDTSSVTDMRGMFRNNSAFNQPICGWDTSSVTNMRGMFAYSQLSPGCSYIWDNGVAVFDNIICRIKHMRGNVIRATTRNGDDCYIFTDGNGSYAHGETLRDAKESLIFKTSDRCKHDYKHMTTDTVLSREQAMLCYHVVTGACRFGIRDFIKTWLNNEPAEQYSIGEIIELTRDAYLGQQFADFFREME